MALEPHRYKGVARDGKIELEPGANLPDGAEVIVLFEGVADRKHSTAQDLLNSDIVGMWADRVEIVDSASFAREIRERAWKRAEP